MVLSDSILPFFFVHSPAAALSLYLIMGQLRFYINGLGIDLETIALSRFILSFAGAGTS